MGPAEIVGAAVVGVEGSGAVSEPAEQHRKSGYCYVPYVHELWLTAAQEAAVRTTVSCAYSTQTAKAGLELLWVEEAVKSIA